MSDYIDLVLVRHHESPKKYLFRAPAFSHLVEGDAVFCETSKGEMLGEVLAVKTVNVDDGETLEFIRESTNAHFPLKRITGKLVLNQFNYSEEDNINGDD